MNEARDKSTFSPGAADERGVRESRDSPTDAFGDFAGRLAEAKEYAATYVSAKADALKLSLRRVLIYAALGIVGLIALAATLVTAVVLLLAGLADAIGAAFHPPRPWAGRLIVGVAVLVAAGAGVVLGLRKITGASRAATMKKYESKHNEQRRRFGHDVTDV